MCVYTIRINIALCSIYTGGLKKKTSCPSEVGGGILMISLALWYSPGTCWRKTLDWLEIPWRCCYWWFQDSHFLIFRRVWDWPLGVAYLAKDACTGRAMHGKVLESWLPRASLPGMDWTSKETRNGARIHVQSSVISGAIGSWIPLGKQADQTVACKGLSLGRVPSRVSSIWLFGFGTKPVRVLHSNLTAMPILPSWKRLGTVFSQKPSPIDAAGKLWMSS